LGQISGIDLGYRYGWYYKGPYCSSLADDYYSLDRIDPASKNPNNLELNDNVKERLSNIRPLLEVPDNVTLAKSSWLELLASLHFLNVVSGLSEHDAETKIQTTKPHVFRYI